MVTAVPVPDMPGPPPVRLDGACAALEAEVASLAAEVQRLRSAVPQRLRLHAEERQAALRLVASASAGPQAGGGADAAALVAVPQPGAGALVPADASAELLDTLDALPGACDRLTATLGKLQRVVTAVHASRSAAGPEHPVAAALQAVVTGTTVAQAAAAAGPDGLDDVAPPAEDVTPPALAAAKVRHMHQAAHALRYAPY
jgi:hypothetical protein